MRQGASCTGGVWGKDDLTLPKAWLKNNSDTLLCHWLGCLACYAKPSLPATQASQREVEVTLQKRLDEVSDELCKTQTSYKSLLADAEKAKGQQQSITGEDPGSTADGAYVGLSGLSPWWDCSGLDKLIQGC